MGSLLGRASGAFLRVMRDAGWGGQGVEPSASQYLRATKVLGDNKDIQQCVLQNAQLSKAYDLVTLCNVFEHVTEPTEFLRLACISHTVENDGQTRLDVAWPESATKLRVPHPSFFCEGWVTTTVCVEICGFPPLPEKHRQGPRISRTLNWTHQRVRLSSKESRMKYIWLTKLDGKSGGMGHPQVGCAAGHRTTQPRRSSLPCW